MNDVRRTVKPPSPPGWEHRVVKAAATDAEVTALLARVPGWAGRARVISALGGGLTNRNLLVAVADEQFVLRSPGNETELLSIDREVERAANERAFTLGIAPEVIAFLEPEQCLVTRFVPGAELTAEQLAAPARLDAISRAVRAFHESGHRSSAATRSAR